MKISRITPTRMIPLYGLVTSIALSCDSSANEPATLFPRALYGEWRDLKTGDSYHFYSNQTYIFRAGAQKRRSGNLSHKGLWTLSALSTSRDLLPFQPYQLKLNAMQRQVLIGNVVINRSARRIFELRCQRAYPSVPLGIPVYLSKNGHYYYRERERPQNVHWLPDPPAYHLKDVQSPNRVFIEDVSFARVK